VLACDDPRQTPRSAAPPLPLHAALPIFRTVSAVRAGEPLGRTEPVTPVPCAQRRGSDSEACSDGRDRERRGARHGGSRVVSGGRSEEHTSELQSRENLVCRLLLVKKNQR